MAGVHTKQKYKCKQCGCNFSVGDAREKVSPKEKALAVVLYASGKAGYGFIARLFFPFALIYNSETKILAHIGIKDNPNQIIYNISV